MSPVSHFYPDLPQHDHEHEHMFLLFCYGGYFSLNHWIHPIWYRRPTGATLTSRKEEKLLSFSLNFLYS
jgi:hypothetical protein